MGRERPARGGWSERVRVAAALRHRNFRIFWLGMVASVLGFQILQVAQLWLTFDLTHSYLKLGFVGASAAVPQILLSLFGGVIADRVDRRRLLQVTQGLMALLMFALALLVYLHLITFEYLVALALLMGVLGGLGQPSQQAMVPYLIDRRDLMNAVALTSAVWQGTRIIGPGIGGVIIDLLGPALCFTVTGIGFLIMVATLAVLRLQPAETPVRRGAFFQEMRGGLSFIRRDTLFFSLIGLSFFNAFFGMAYIGIMAGFAKEVLDLGGTGLGILVGASGIGALAGTLTIGSLGGLRRRGWLIIGGSLLFGSFLILFAFSRIFPLSLFLLVLVGAANSTYMVALMTQLQVSVPDALRGRVMGVFGMTYSMMPLGSLPMGTVASFFGSPVAVALGGGMVILFSLAVAARVPEVLNLLSSPPGAERPAGAQPHRHEGTGAGAALPGDGVRAERSRG